MDRCRYILTSLALLCESGVILSAQGGYGVGGTVEDSVGPVIGAAVIEQGTSNGTLTGPDGGFSLTVSSPDSPVEISCVGYVSQTYQASQLPSTVVLKEDTETLKEVVVIGYGTVRKDDMT